MPFDLWFRDREAPARFEPERVPVPPLPSLAMAEEVVRFFRFAGRIANFELVAVEVDAGGRIVPEQVLSADDLNAIAQGAEAVGPPTIVAPDGSRSSPPIALEPPRTRLHDERRRGT